jgi:hypothetical protein
MCSDKVKVMSTAQIDELIREVGALRTIMIDVATGSRRIEEAESEYTKLRAESGRKLRMQAIVDPNVFHSLWDWYGYWKDNGLSSYQSRRAYVNSLYKPIIDALEAAGSQHAAGKQSQQSFSARHGYTHTPSEAQITIREDAPQELRATLVEIAIKVGYDYDDLFTIASQIGKQPWHLPEAHESGKSSRAQVYRMLMGWEWYLVYDFAERLFAILAKQQLLDAPEDEFARLINDYFRHTGIGWQLRDGMIISRGSETFETAIKTTLLSISETGLATAHREFHEALIDLSRRPHADLTGAIQHAMAALECVARSASQDPHPTLGKLLERHPGLIPKPLDIAVEKAWGYASEQGRHVREGREPSREETELIVGIAASVAGYLAKKISS